MNGARDARGHDPLAGRETWTRSTTAVRRALPSREERREQLDLRAQGRGAALRRPVVLAACAFRARRLVLVARLFVRRVDALREPLRDEAPERRVQRTERHRLPVLVREMFFHVQAAGG